MALSLRRSQVLRIGVSVLLLAIVFALSDWRNVRDVLANVNGAWVTAAIGLAVLDRFIISYRWQVFLAGLGVKSRFWYLLRVQFAANFAGSFLPSSIGVDALRAAALVRGGEPVAPVIASTFVDRFSLVLASLLFGSAMLLALAQARVPSDVSHAIFGLTLIAALGCALCLYLPLRRWLRKRILARVPMRFRARLGEIAAAVLAYRTHWRVLASAGIVTIALFAIRIVFAKVLGMACGVDIPLLDLLVIIPLLWIIVMIPVTIGGIGVQEAGYVMLMALIGVGPAIGLSMSLLEHVVSRAASLPGAVFLGEISAQSPWLARTSRRKRAGRDRRRGAGSREACVK